MLEGDCEMHIPAGCSRRGRVAVYCRPALIQAAGLSRARSPKKPVPSSTRLTVGNICLFQAHCEQFGTASHLPSPRLCLHKDGI